MAIGWAHNSMTEVSVVFRHDPYRRLVKSDLTVVFLGATVFPIRSFLGDLGPRSLPV